MQSDTPAIESAVGVSLVCARPLMARAATRRPPLVYASWMFGRLDRLGRTVASTADQRPDPAPMDDRPGDDRHQGTGDAVEPEVVGGGHDREADPGRPQEPERLEPPRAHDVEERDPDDQRV